MTKLALPQSAGFELTTTRLVFWLLRRFRTLTSSLSVIPTVHQKRAPATRWVRRTLTTLNRESAADGVRTESENWGVVASGGEL
jgi:hypothetical protein